MSVTRLEDKEGDWLRQSFMVPRKTISLIQQRRQMVGATQFKFTNASLGGNFYINPVPQFTRYADIRVPGKLAGNLRARYDGSGMGRYYSEAIDDPAQVIYMSFGVPTYNSLTTFWTGFYNSEASVLARTGRAAGFFATVGRTLGFIASIPLWPIILAGVAYRWATNSPSSKYYYLKPTMPLYWNAVNTICNALAVNMGIVPRVLTDQQHVWIGKGDANADTTAGTSDMKALHNLAPDIYYEGGGIDIYAVANKATRLAAKMQAQVADIMGTNPDPATMAVKLDEYMYSVGSHGELHDDGPVGAKDGKSGIDGYLDRYLNSQMGSRNPPSDKPADGKNSSTDAKPKSDGTATQTIEPEIEEATGRSTQDAKTGEIKKGWISSFFEAAKAENQDGSAFVSFRVNHTGTADESFSSSARDSDIMSTVNSKSSAARNMRFNFAGGNVGGGVVGAMLGGIIDGAREFVSGVGEGLGISGIAALAGSAFVDIPKQWESSTFSAPTMSYTLELRSPYGNKLSRFNNLYVPLAMILAGALPLSTGQQSYTSPFLCNLFSKGRAQTRLGIIESLSIRRGVGNMGWSPTGECLGIDITFTVMDLSSIMHMPITSEPWINPLRGLMAEDTAFNDYLAVLGGLGLDDQRYLNNRLKLTVTKSMVRFRRWTSPARWASWYGGTLPGKLMNDITQQVYRPK